MFKKALLLTALCVASAKSACDLATLPLDWTTANGISRSNLNLNPIALRDAHNDCADSLNALLARFTGYGGALSVASNQDLILKVDADANGTHKLVVTSNNVDSMLRIHEDGTARIFDHLVIDSNLTVRKVTASDSVIGTAGKFSGAITASNFNGFANPSTSIGLSANNGSAITAMRSDAAPALSQAIRPTWTDLHTFRDTVVVDSPATFNKSVGLGIGDPNTPIVSGIGQRLESASNADNVLVVSSHKATDPRAGFAAITTQGTKASPSTLGATMPIVMLRGYAYRGGYFMGSSWQSYTDGAHGASNHGSFWALRAIPNGSTASLTEWMRAWRNNWLVSSINSAAETPGDHPMVMGADTSKPFVGWNAYYDHVNTPGYKFGAGSSSHNASILSFDVTTGTLSYKVSSSTGNADGAITFSTPLTLTGTAMSLPSTVDLNLAKLTASQAVFTDASKNLVSNAITGSGNVMMSASPTTTGTLTGAAANFSGNLAANSSSSLFAVGGGTTSGVAAYVSSSHTGLTGTTQAGVFSQPTFNSSATSAGYTYRAQLRTAASSFTMGTGVGVRIEDANKGSGSTITSQIGLDIADQTQGATNYAIRTGAGLVSLGGAITAASTLTASDSIRMQMTSLGTTARPGNILINTTAAAAGAQQYSPATVWEGRGWKTNATAASQPVSWKAFTVPVQGAANPTAEWHLQSNINGGSFTTRLKAASDGTVTAPGPVVLGTTNVDNITVNGQVTSDFVTIASANEGEALYSIGGSSRRWLKGWFYQGDFAGRVSVSSDITYSSASTPSDPSSNGSIRQYQSGSKIVYQYNDGGTVRYKYLDMAGTGVTWVHTTSAP